MADEIIKNKDVITSLHVFPKDICIGDTIYVSIQTTNNTETEITKITPEPFRHWYGRLGVKWFLIVGTKKWEIDHYTVSPPKEVESAGLPKVRIRPHTTETCFVQDVRVAGLEDLKESFWLEFLKNIPVQGTAAELVVEYAPGATIWQDVVPQVLREKINIKPRRKEEVDLIENWYQKTPKDELPRLKIFANPNDSAYRPAIDDKWKRKYYDFYGQLEKLHLNYKPSFFLRPGNNYPGYPNLPKDWRGWRKLEESFCESTLRDEIRWTRICIQYCETKDEKVLEELKSWLEKMNPIQRAVMVNYIQKNEQLPESIKLHNTIQPFKNKPITNDIDKK
jgi:hypothetical protein